MNLNDLEKRMIESKTDGYTGTNPHASAGITKDVEGVLMQRVTSIDNKWELRGCPRCHGDVFLDSEDGDILGHCLQCGYVGLVAVTAKSVN